MRQAADQLSHVTVKKSCLRVPKSSGQSALITLASMNLLDRESQPKLQGERLILPLARQPNPGELDILQSSIPGHEFGQDFFDQKPVTPRTLVEALEGKLPPHLIASLPSSFDIIGDIAIVEYSTDQSQFEGLMAEAILRVHKNVRAVFAKAGAILGDERIRPLRHVAGENRTVTIHREFGCRFKVDLAKVYFSPRLSTEHERVASMVQNNETVIDMFAGVGPFSILIAKKLDSVKVHAIDANPEAAKLIKENLRLNRPRGTVKVWAEDARRVVDEHLRQKISRVVMNLPSTSREFVDVACKALHSTGGILHYYTFSDGIHYREKAVAELEQALSTVSWSFNEKPGVRQVRGVAPLQWQVVVDAEVVPR